MSQQKITVKLLGREYQFGCEEHERTSLLTAADHLDKTMRGIKSHNSTMTADKVALMAAMNISHEYIKSQSLNTTYDKEVIGKVKIINDRLEQLLASDI